MNIHIQLSQFLEGLEEQRKAILSYLPVNGYKTTQELFSACAEWIDLEHGPWAANGYKEYFWNIVTNLKHENSQHLALAVFIKANACSEVQLFLLLRLLAKTATDSSWWDNRMETYLDRGKAIFSQEELDTLFKVPQEVYQIGEVLQYNKRSIFLNRHFIYVKQFLGVLPKVN